MSSPRCDLNATPLWSGRAHFRVESKIQSFLHIPDETTLLCSNRITRLMPAQGQQIVYNRIYLCLVRLLFLYVWKLGHAAKSPATEFPACPALSVMPCSSLLTSCLLNLALKPGEPFLTVCSLQSTQAGYKKKFLALSYDHSRTCGCLPCPVTSVATPTLQNI
jgi:hypothetical protein